MAPLAMTSGTHSTRNAGNPTLTSCKSIETHYGQGQPDAQAEASDNLSTTSSKLKSKLLRCQNYKPTALRWWYHGFLIICLATFIGLTEYAIQTRFAKEQKDLESQLSPRSLEDHRRDEQFVSDCKEPSYQRLARVPSNATSSQAGAYSVNTGDFLALGYSSATLAAPTDLVSSDSTSSNTLPSTELLLSYGEPADKSSIVIASKSSATSDPYLSMTDALDTASQTIVSPGPSITILNFTESTGSTIAASTIYATDGYLNLGTTTSTVRNPTPDVKTSDLSGGYEITVPFSPTPSPEAGDASTSDMTMPFTSAYLHIGPTSSTTTRYATITPSTGGYLSIGVTTASMGNDKDPPSPEATIPKVVDTISESALSPNQEPITTVAQHTETWAPSETIMELISTDSEGRVATQRTRTTLPGRTSVYESTKTLSPEVYGESVAVVRQTEVWPSSKTTLERTITDSRGHAFVQTITTDTPARTDILETKVTMRPGETLVAIPKIITTTRGGLTQVTQTTLVDSEGHTATLLYTTVVAVESVLATRTYFLATSLPPGYTVLTLPNAVPTIERGMIEVIQTVYTDAEGRVTRSAYATTLNGIPTTRTVPLVIAAPVIPGNKLMTLSTMIPTTIGGKTKVIKTTSTDGRGQPTAFSYTTVEGGTPTSTTVWTIVPTPTSTSSSSSNGTQDTESVAVVVYGLGLRDYMLGAFLPTILAAIIAYPFKLININAKLMQPFHELAIAREADGVSAEASIFLRFYDWTGALSLPRSVRLKQPVIVISDFLVFGAALLAPIAAETVSVHVPDGCDSGCYGSLGVTTIPGRVLETLMATMVALLIALIVLLNVFRWETGVSHNPWGIAGMASLGMSPGIRDRIRKIPCDSRGSIKESIMLEVLTGSKYALDEYWVSSSPGSVGVRGYGIVVKTSNGHANKPEKINRRGHGGSRGHKCEKERVTQPFALLTWWGRCTLLFIFACVLIMATYYETTSLDSGFERFMDSRGFGIRFFFTALGVVIGGCMETFFRSVAIMLPYQLLSKHALPAERSILLSPPTNAFYGVYSAFRKRSIFLGALSFATILAELFLPVTLSHIPFSHLDTYQTQLVCAWLSISILAFMILVILYSFCIRWPHMPVDPRTIAGAMFYVCDSWMLGAMEDMATLGKKERDSTVYAQRLNYVFGSSKGVSGGQRMNVDFCEEKGEAAVTIQDEKARYG